MKGKSFITLVILIISSVHIDTCIATPVSVEGEIYWTTVFGRSIRKADLLTHEQGVVVSGTNVNTGIALDSVNGKIYWSGVQPQGIYRADIDGSNIELLIGPCGPSGLCGHNGITLDLAAGKMYWTESGTSQQYYKLRRANLDGSDVEDVIPTSMLTRPAGIALDLSSGKVYWAEGALGDASGKIRRADLDGMNIENLVTVGVNTFGLELDVAGSKMYWTNNNEGQLWRANIDGASPELLASGLDNPLGLALDLFNGKIYYAEHHAGIIKTANLDGTDITDFLITDRFEVQGLALHVIPEPATLLLLGLGGILLRKKRK
jgi:hypothetical protein